MNINLFNNNVSKCSLLQEKLECDKLIVLDLTWESLSDLLCSFVRFSTFYSQSCKVSVKWNSNQI